MNFFKKLANTNYLPIYWKNFTTHTKLVLRGFRVRFCMPVDVSTAIQYTTMQTYPYLFSHRTLYKTNIEQLVYFFN